jgi:hypothetical protein
MSSERKVLDQGELPGGLSWEATGLSPACGCTFSASWNGHQRSGFSVHPLMLLSAPRRQQMAAELLLPAVAKVITGEVAVGPDAAAAAIEGATTGEHLEAAQQLAAAWKQAREQCRRLAGDQVEHRRQVPVAAAAAT